MCPDFTYTYGTDYMGNLYPTGPMCNIGGVVISVYCGGDYIYCPCHGGDDRYRRVDALTEKVSDCIACNFKECLEAGERRMHELLVDAAEIIRNTNYELLCDGYYRAGRREFTLSVAGRFKGAVRSPMERRQAEALECSMQEALDSFRPSEVLPDIFVDGSRVCVSEMDFDNLEFVISQIGNVGIDLLWHTNVCAVPQYNYIVAGILQNLSNEIYLYLRYFQECFFEVRTQFQNSIHSAAWASEMGTHGFQGAGPRWRNDFF